MLEIAILVGFALLGGFVGGVLGSSKVHAVESRLRADGIALEGRVKADAIALESRVHASIDAIKKAV